MVATVLGVAAAVILIGLAADALVHRYTQLVKLPKLRMFRSKTFPAGRVAIYLEPRDLWVGVFNDRRYLYVCPLPTLVVRWAWGPVEPDPLDHAMHTVWLDSGKWRWTTQKMTTQEREAAVAAVLRYSNEHLEPDHQMDRSSLAWWD